MGVVEVNLWMQFLKGVLSHPSACHGPCIFPSSQLLEIMHCSRENTERFNRRYFSAVVHPFCLGGFEFPANPSTGNSLFCTFSGDLEVFAQTVFQADLTGKGKLSSLLTKPLRDQGEKVGLIVLPPSMIIMLFFTGGTGGCGVFWNSCSNKAEHVKYAGYLGCGLPPYFYSVSQPEV